MVLHNISVTLEIFDWRGLKEHEKYYLIFIIQYPGECTLKIQFLIAYM